MLDTICGSCGGPGGTGVVLDDTPAGQAWLCGGCQINRRTNQRAGKLALLEAAQATSTPERAAGIAIAVKELTGADLPAQREEADVIDLGGHQTVKVQMVPHLRLVITGMFAAIVATIGGFAIAESAALANSDPPATAAPSPHMRRHRRPTPRPAAVLPARRPAPQAAPAGLLAVRSAATV